MKTSALLRAPRKDSFSFLAECYGAVLLKHALLPDGPLAREIAVSLIRAYASGIRRRRELISLASPTKH